jgi:L-ascorbate metabolism protein UlaG (beta-lactamase superfamily)
MSPCVGTRKAADRTVPRRFGLACLVATLVWGGSAIAGLAGPAGGGRQAAATQTAGRQGASAAGVEVRFLANAGFLLRTSDVGVLIDAFVAEPRSPYGDVPTEVLREMINGGAPFHGVRLALVSHRHEDHFQADVARLFLDRHPQASLVSSPQVIEALRAQTGQLPENAHLVWPDSTDTRTWNEASGIRVDFLRLPHESARHADVQNLVHVVTLGGRRILHLGDATMQSDAYAPYADQLQDIDVALIPYWFFDDEEGRKTIATWLQARLQIAMHVPAGEEESVQQRLQATDPRVRVFTSSMQFVRY